MGMGRKIGGGTLIGKLQGRLDEVLAGAIILNVGGVGYMVRLPGRELSTLGRSGDEITLYIHTHVREESLDLYGFSNRDELSIFQMLMGVSGVGPRMAVAVLDTLSASDVYLALSAGDTTMLTRVPGVGRKTAERLILELKDKVDGLDQPPLGPVAPAEGDVAQAIEALQSLGYPRTEVLRVVQQVGQAEREEGLGVETLIRRCLNVLSSEGGSG